MEPSFTLRLHRPEAPEAVWARLWDLDRHSASIPLTAVTSANGDPLRLDARFTGRTALGRLGFDDVMVVRAWDPPRHAVVEKVGRWLTGRVTVDLVSDGDGTVVVWQQSFGARWVPGRLAALAAPLVRRGYAASLRRILS